MMDFQTFSRSSHAEYLAATKPWGAEYLEMVKSVGSDDVGRIDLGADFRPHDVVRVRARLREAGDALNLGIRFKRPPRAGTIVFEVVWIVDPASFMDDEPPAEAGVLDDVPF